MSERTALGAGERRPVVILNCGTIATGIAEHPVSDGDAIVVSGGLITQVGAGSDISIPGEAIIVDAKGMDLIPGLIDSHIHPVVGGDWTPRMSTVGWLASYAQAGITTAISQGSWHQGGYPTDTVGMVALAITLARVFKEFRPGRMKVHGATVSLVDGLGQSDFELLAQQGVWLISEIGSRSIIDPAVVRAMLDLAHPLGFISRVHFGPEAVPGTHTITASMASRMGGHIASHVNGGPSSPPAEDLDFMVEQTDYFLELSYPGNHRALLRVAQRANDLGMLGRLIAGSDTPTGAGILPRAILGTIGLVATFTDIPVTDAIAIGTGNTARAYGINTGRIETGREADVLLIDAPKGSLGSSGLESLEIGDTPSVAFLMISGEIVSVGTQNTLPAKRQVVVDRPL
ncbi:MAG: amidohydrolase family protein [Acidimicrobiia bacterium]